MTRPIVRAVARRIRAAAAAAALPALVFAATLATPTSDAEACPPGCPSPIHPCCCPTPCPVNDGTNQGLLKQISGWQEQMLEEYGISIPSFDALGNPLSCMGGGGMGDLASASSLADMSSLGHFAGPGGFTEMPGLGGGLGELFPIGEGIEAIGGGMAGDLSALGGKLGLDNLEGLTGAAGIGDLSGLKGVADFSQLGEMFPVGEGMQAISGGMAGDLSALGGKLGGIEGGPDFSQLGEMFPVGEGMQAIGGGMAGDLGRLSQRVGIPDLGSMTDIGDLSGLRGLPGLDSLPRSPGLSDLAKIPGVESVDDLGKLSRLSRLPGIENLDVPTEDAGKLFPIGEGMEQIRTGAARDAAAAGDAFEDLFSDVEVDRSASDFAPTTGGRFQASPTGGDADAPRGELDDLVPDAQEGYDAVSRGMSRDLSALGGKLGIGSGGGETVLRDLSDLATLPGVGDAADLNRLTAIAQSGSVPGVSSISDLAALKGTPGFNSLADFEALPDLAGIPGVDGLGDIAGLSQGLGRIPGISGIGDIGAVTDIAGGAGMGQLASMAGIGGDVATPAGALSALSGLSACGAQSTPVTGAMMDDAGLVGMQQAMRNALAGPSAVNNVVARHDPADLRIPELALDPSLLPPVRSAGDGDLDAAAERTAAAFYESGPDRASREKTLEARRQTARRAAVNAYGRALAKRGHLATTPTAHVEKLRTRVAEAATFAEDVRINSEIKMSLISRYQELAELKSARLRLESAVGILADGEIRTAGRAPADVQVGTSPGDRARMQSANKALADLSGYRSAVQEAVQAHNALSAVKNVDDHLPQLLEIVEQHETRKRHQHAMEREIKSHLAALYVDPDSAWRSLKSDLLNADGTGYVDGNRWYAAQTAARGVVPAVLAQQRTTRYGQRRPNPNCSVASRPERQFCPPYTTGPLSADAGRAAISSHYTGYQRYKVEARMRQPAGKDRTGGSSAQEDALFQSIQYFLEARKRKLYHDDMRRGDGSEARMATTADLWNELVEHAPECLSGPLPATRANIAERPGMFDVAPQCGHRVWKSGPMEGALINHLQLGGVDQSIWMSRNAQIEYAYQHGGREEIESLVKRADDLGGEDLRTRLMADDRVGLVREMDVLEKVLDEVRRDTENKAHVDYRITRG